MSRVGKLPVEIPSGVQVNVDKGNITVKGAKGELKTHYTSDVNVEMKDGKLWVRPRNKAEKRSRALWGTVRSNVQGMVEGVSKGFTKRLAIQGVGYRASSDKNFLTLALGYSHEIKYAIPTGIEIKCETPTMVVISGFDKQLVGQVASEIRSLRKPEPYKGKGVRYEGEHIVMKEGKKK